MFRKLLLGAASAVLLTMGTAVATVGTSTAAPKPVAVSNTSKWSPCASSQQGPPYVVIVKGVYGTCVHYEAQVFQFDSITGKKAMLVYVTNEGDGVWDNLVWVNLPSVSLGSSIYENNIVYLVGRLDGTYTYDTSTFGTNTVPVIDVTQLRLANTKPTTTTTARPTTTTTVKPKTSPTTVGPVTPIVKVIAEAHASGSQAEADATGEATAFPIEAVVTATPPQAADFNWSVSCGEGNGGTGTLQGDKTVPVPVVYHLKAPSGVHDCFAEADVTLSGSGTITVKIED